MQPTPAQQLNPQVSPHTDPHDDIVAILRNGTSRPTLDPSELRVDRADRPAAAAPAPAVEPELRPARSNDNRTLKAPAAGPRRGNRFLRFLLTVCFGVAVTVGWQSYGEAARRWLVTQVPQLAAILPVETPSETVSEQAGTAPAEATEEAAAPEQAAAATDTAAAAPPAASAPAESAAPVQAAAPPPDLTPAIEGMSREIVSLRETIEELKTSQQQMGRELAKAVEKIGEQETRRRTAAPTPTPRPAAQPTRSPAPPPPPPQAVARPQPLMPPPPSSTYSPGQPYIPSSPRPPATLP
ncbi:hypothetical protein [Bradyrhizobium sp. LHD-71]|uniref:hypothetical protein n=1 Tax=Bradyrhizobium sp. LHD-71 TaxID=3072141 RepID=UPI00280DACBD|nr:hypothetical protein [Bradyrhizobium sp. LHD-71]MDQ8730672.1 hypothetical protein [Bradyrhizobium sp. LHD-71]